jgi:rubrerythrin
MNKELILQNLNRGLEFEQQAQDACEEIMSFFDDKPTLDTIRYIRDDEVKHIGLVKELIRIINKY